MINRFFHLRIIFLFVCSLFFAATALAQNDLTIRFVHTANGKPVLQDSIYSNANGEIYTISKLKYYCSNFPYNQSQSFLIDAFADDSIHISLPEGKYKQLSFLLGVDSLHNCSGAQDGALDPLNDMFWAWNSGYVMFKLEGNSASSPADLHRIEHHIGGFRGANKTMRAITLSLPQELVMNGRHKTIVIEMNLDQYWHSINDIKISENPVIVVAGPLAKKSADNFPQLFTIKSVN